MQDAIANLTSNVSAESSAAVIITTPSASTSDVETQVFINYV